MMEHLTVDSYLSNQSAGNEVLNRIWDQIPKLDEVENHNVTDGALFRFCGMVQDMPNPVYYYEEYAVQNLKTGQISKRCGKFRDGLVCAEDEKLLLDSDSSVSSERRPYYCVSVPALNTWARMRSTPRQNDRPMTTGTSSMPKRNAEDMDVDDGDRSNSQEDSSNKRLCSLETRQVTSSPGAIDAHFPLPSRLDVACVVHIYDADDRLKVNDVIDVVGFTYVTGMDQDDVDVPPSLAPRLHAVAVRTPFNVNPLVTIDTKLEDVLNSAAALRSDLHLALTQLLLGDHLAADYLICHLLSNVYRRQDAVVLGKFSLNLSNVPLDTGYTAGIFDVLSLLVAKSHFFPMSLHNMNTANLVPVKNYDTNRLKSGVLQLSDRTHFIVDETKLKTGKLQERGVKNVQVLNTLLSEQTVNYDFKFYSVPFLVNIPVLVFSEGKSLLQCDAHVKLVPDASFEGPLTETLEAVRSFLKEPLLSGVRTYLTVLAGQVSTLPSGLAEDIQNDFVTMRQENPNVTPDEMHAHLVLARLLSLSYGKSVLDKDIWNRASELERVRKSRLSN